MQNSPQAVVSSKAAEVAQEVRTNGFSVWRNALDDGAIRLIRNEWEKSRSRIEDGTYVADTLFVKQDGEPVISEELASLRRHPVILDIARAYLGNDIGWYYARQLVKRPGGEMDSVQIHQDWPYNDGGTDKLSFMIAMGPHSPELGGLTFYKNSHYIGPVERGGLDPSKFSELEPVDLNVDVGDLVICHWLAWHGSHPMAKPNWRPMMQLVLQPADDIGTKEVILGNRKSPFPMDAIAERVQSNKDILPGFIKFSDIKKALNGGDLTSAKIRTEAIINYIDPNSIEARCVLAELLWLEGDQAGAEQQLELARASHESNAQRLKTMRLSAG